uniref:Uncharacterized protein n=1 Tax=Tanacetum cinerariifolium TaxID=118510 RepID=A0A699JSX9_TANCI|nr:hypothetical protein [Tanacetum cinerariifolium]
MTQSGSGVSSASSFGNVLNQSRQVLIFERWASPVSYNSERCISSCIRLSSTGGRELGFCLEKLEGASCISKSPLEEVKEDLDHHDAFCEMYPMLHEVNHCCHIAWMLQEIHRELHAPDVVCRSYFQTSNHEVFLSFELQTNL